MKDNKDIIKEIVSQLRNKKDVDYREGAWERFVAQNQVAKKETSPLLYWMSAAAVLLLLGISGVLYVQREGQDKSLATAMSYVDKVETPSVTENQEDVDPLSSEEKSQLHGDAQSYVQGASAVPVHATAKQRESHFISKNNQLTLSRLEGNSPVTDNTYQGPLLVMDVSPETVTAFPRIADRSNLMVTATASLPTLASSTAQLYNGTGKQVEELSGAKSFMLNKKVELGLFVSPYATSQNMQVGGGFSLAYNITSKLSVRTGASYNSYLVNEQRNPVSTTVEVDASVAMANGMENLRLEASSESLYQTRMLIPNINSMSGVVKSLDIPLEMKYNVAKGFYASAGVAYSAILNQERNAHYIENVNTETFANGYPTNEAEMSAIVTPVTKTVRALENNVDPNGFSGFVNFSIGKQVKVNNKLGFSVEPYVKIPLGQYRRADMDYTNGGVRVVTNF